MAALFVFPVIDYNDYMQVINRIINSSSTATAAAGSTLAATESYKSTEYFWMIRMDSKIDEICKKAYKAFNFHYIHKTCNKIKALEEKKKWSEAEQYRNLIETRGTKEFIDIAKNYNAALQQLDLEDDQDVGGYLLDLENIEDEFKRWKKKLIAITINGLFDDSYSKYKKYYNHKHRAHYPKSAEYARIALKFPMIYRDCKNVSKVLVFYYVQNTAEGLTETRQKVMMQSDQGREHFDRSKFEMERIGAGSLSRYVSNERTNKRVGISMAQNHRGSPFLKNSKCAKSQVLDRRKMASEEFIEFIKEHDLKYLLNLLNL